MLRWRLEMFIGILGTIVTGALTAQCLLLRWVFVLVSHVSTSCGASINVVAFAILQGGCVGSSSHVHNCLVASMVRELLPARGCYLPPLGTPVCVSFS